MNFKKIFIFIALSMVIGFLGCAKEKEEAPKQQRITKNLVPPTVEVKGTNFSIALSNLQVVTTEDTTSKEIVGTPSLMGRIKITNMSKDNLDIQAVTVDYFDEAGKPIDFESGDKIANVNLYLKVLKPEETFEGSLDVTIPKKAVKGKTLGKMVINLVFVSSPLNRETATFTEKIE
jgi:hypothetical protein